MAIASCYRCEFVCMAYNVPFHQQLLGAVEQTEDDTTDRLVALLGDPTYNSLENVETTNW